MAKPQRKTKLANPPSRKSAPAPRVAAASVAARPTGSMQPTMRGKPKGQQKGQKKGDGYNIVALVLILLVAMMAFALPSFIILFGGMTPTWIAFIVDDRRMPYRLNTIGACNLAGVIPFLGSLWLSGHELSHAFMMLTDPIVWATMFLGATTGMGALWVGPHIAAMIYNTRAIKQRRDIELNRRALIEEWGVDILPPQDAVDKMKPAPTS